MFLKLFGKNILIRWTKGKIVILNYTFVEKSLKNCIHQSSIVDISHSSSIIALSYQIFESLKRQSIVHVVNIKFDLSTADSQITLSELIGNCPA